MLGGYWVDKNLRIAQGWQVSAKGGLKPLWQKQIFASF